MTFFGMALLTAVGTVVLAVFAIVTAWYARKAFTKQSQEVTLLLEQNERDKDERCKAQAAKVFIGAEEDPGRLVSPYAANASDTPVYHARVWYGDREGLPGGQEFLDMIPPGGTRSAAREFGSAVDALECTFLIFRDASGLWWVRTPRGELEEDVQAVLKRDEGPSQRRPWPPGGGSLPTRRATHKP
jgi:hypothetical protein